MNVKRKHARLNALDNRGKLIADDDGDLAFSKDAKEGVEPFLQQRFNPLIDVGVKSIAWCSMWGIAVGKEETTYWETQQLNRPLNNIIHDPTTVMVEAAKENDIEIFSSIRMNDTHDAIGKPHGKLNYPLKVQNLDWLLGSENQESDFKKAPESLIWSGLNYAIEKVREDRLWWIRHTIDNYNIDGIDLNFFRMPWFFKPGQVLSGIPIMTNFIRNVSNLIDRNNDKFISKLLGVRVPGTIEACFRVGIDIETWLKEGLVDRLLVGGGYMPYTNPFEELVSLGHQYEVPVYPCINFGVNDTKQDAAVRGAATNIYWSGADGIYLWNYQYRDAPKLSYGRPVNEVYELLRELSLPSVMDKKAKLFCVENLEQVTPYSIASDTTQLPLDLGTHSFNSTKMVRMRIGDKLNRISVECLLILKLEGLKDGDSITLQINGRLLSSTLKPSSYTEADNLNGKLFYEVPNEVIVTGDNRLVFWIDDRDTRHSNSILLSNVWLHVYGD